MDNFTAAWSVVKENLSAWIIVGLVYTLAISITGGIAALLITPNLFRATRNALAQNRGPEMGELFNFDHIGDDIMAMLLYGVAVGIGSIACGVGALAAAVLFFWVPMLAADGRLGGMEAMKASLAHAKGAIAPIIIFTLIAYALNMVASLVCFLPVLVTAPVTFVAMWQYYQREQDAIYQMAAQQGIPFKA